MDIDWSNATLIRNEDDWDDAILVLTKAGMMQLGQCNFYQDDDIQLGLEHRLGRCNFNFDLVIEWDDATLILT